MCFFNLCMTVSFLILTCLSSFLKTYTPTLCFLTQTCMKFSIPFLYSCDMIGQSVVPSLWSWARETVSAWAPLSFYLWCSEVRCTVLCENVISYPNLRNGLLVGCSQSNRFFTVVRGMLDTFSESGGVKMLDAYKTGSSPCPPPFWVGGPK